MSQVTVDYVLEIIDQLSDEDRLTLLTLLTQRLEGEWAQSVADNQRVARERGISEQVIEQAIHRRRYGE